MFEVNDLFLRPEAVGPRDWGEELLIHVCSGCFTFKLLKMSKGMKGGLQYHRLKDECAYLVSGELLVRFDLQDGRGLQERVLLPGSSVRFPPGLAHQEEALTDVVLLEASTPHFNDRVRVEEQYGFDTVAGLPSTSLDEIETG